MRIAILITMLICFPIQSINIGQSQQNEKIYATFKKATCGRAKNEIMEHSEYTRSETILTAVAQQRQRDEKKEAIRIQTWFKCHKIIASTF
jgi:hypothetical protein